MRDRELADCLFGRPEIHRVLAEQQIIEASATTFTLYRVNLYAHAVRSDEELTAGECSQANNSNRKLPLARQIGACHPPTTNSYEAAAVREEYPHAVISRAHCVPLLSTGLYAPVQWTNATATHRKNQNRPPTAAAGQHHESGPLEDPFFYCNLKDAMPTLITADSELWNLAAFENRTPVTAAAPGVGTKVVNINLGQPKISEDGATKRLRDGHVRSSHSYTEANENPWTNAVASIGEMPTFYELPPRASRPVIFAALEGRRSKGNSLGVPSQKNCEPQS
eukprot:GHVT01096443.1.p1 GENE.GHVT01096443.1~~GHVT01096443.1.p1  ORF type:complete len:280 (-),score=41.88 GHVT01096443.1:712-1551(-)